MRSAARRYASVKRATLQELWNYRREKRNEWVSDRCRRQKRMRYPKFVNSEIPECRMSNAAKSERARRDAYHLAYADKRFELLYAILRLSLYYHNIHVYVYLRSNSYSFLTCRMRKLSIRSVERYTRVYMYVGAYVHQALRESRLSPLYIYMYTRQNPTRPNFSSPRIVLSRVSATRLYPRVMLAYM